MSATAPQHQSNGHGDDYRREIGEWREHTRVVLQPVAVPALAYWFYPLAAVTLMGALAALVESLAITTMLLLLGVGAGFLGVFYTVGGGTWAHVGGYVTMASAFAAFYTASAMMLASTWGRTVLPLGRYRREANVPGGRPVYPIQFVAGEPGVKQGQ